MEFDYSLQPGRERKRELVKKELKPYVSIITPYFNGSKYFEQTFHCVINQTFPWFEWVIVDDGSSQKEHAYLMRLAEMDKRITVYTKKNGGPANARNYAIDRTNTDIIVSLDADDLIVPAYIEMTYWALYFHPDAGWAYTDSLGFGRQNYRWKVPFDSEKLKKENFLIEVGTIRKQALIHAGKYDDREKHSHEDWRLWLQLLEKGYYPIHLGCFGAWYRRVAQGSFSKTENDRSNRKRAYRKIQEVADRIDRRIEATEYPVSRTKKSYYEPKMIRFEEVDGENKQKIHILLIIPWMAVGGADKFNLEFVKNMNRDQFAISIITTVKNENDWQQKFAGYVDQIFTLPDFLDPAHDLDFIGYYVKAKAVDVVLLTNAYQGYYMLPWLRKNFPNLYITDYVHMEEWYWKAGGYARISGMMGGLLDRTYVCNSVTRTVMMERFGRPADSIKTIHIGADTEVFDETIVKQGYLYRRYKIPQNKKIVLFPCRIHPQKRPFLMLAIAENVSKKNKDVVFVAVGDGEQFEELKSEIRKRNLQDTVICTGCLDHMRECYKDARLTLICSLKEGLALTAYESCAMSVPVISSDVGGQKDLIDETVGRLIQTRQDEKTGICDRNYDRSEIEEFTNAILLFLEDEQLYQACCKNCRQKVVREFSVRNMVQKMQTEILELMSDDSLTRRHMHMSEVLKEQGKFAEEFYTSYLTLEEKEQECEEIWQAKCYLENRLLCRKKDYNLWLDGICRKCKQAVKTIYLLFLKVRPRRNKG